MLSRRWRSLYNAANAASHKQIKCVVDISLVVKPKEVERDWLRRLSAGMVFKAG